MSTLAGDDRIRIGSVRLLCLTFVSHISFPSSDPAELCKRRTRSNTWALTDCILEDLVQQRLHIWHVDQWVHGMVAEMSEASWSRQLVGR